MHTFEKTLFNAMLPMFERALADAANNPRAAAVIATAATAATAATNVATPVAARSPAPQLPRAA